MCRAEREREARRTSDWWELYYLEGALGGLLELTDFAPSVFLDWLADADVPCPPEERSWKNGQDNWQAWLEGLSQAQLTHLYEGLHHFDFYEVREVDWIEGGPALGQWDDWDRELAQRAAGVEALRRQREEARRHAAESGGQASEDDIPF
jgi:hypothetical protein